MAAIVHKMTLILPIALSLKLTPLQYQPAYSQQLRQKEIQKGYRSLKI